MKNMIAVYREVRGGTVKSMVQEYAPKKDFTADLKGNGLIVLGVFTKEQAEAIQDMSAYEVSMTGSIAKEYIWQITLPSMEAVSEEVVEVSEAVVEFEEAVAKHEAGQKMLSKREYILMKTDGMVWSDKELEDYCGDMADMRFEQHGKEKYYKEFEQMFTDLYNLYSSVWTINI